MPLPADHASGFPIPSITLVSGAITSRPFSLKHQDRHMFLKYLHRAYEQCPLDLLGYCLMGNHYHLQVKTLSEPLGKTMHYLNTLYAGYFNFRYGKHGHVFENRYHSIPVEVDAYLLVLSRYIHLNPVVAGIVKRPEDYPGSSYREYLGARPLSLIKCDLVLDTLSENREKQRDIYKEFVQSEIEATAPVYGTAHSQNAYFWK